MRAVFLFVALIAFGNHATARCFEPLVQRDSTDPKKWQDLIDFVPRDKPEGVKTHLPIPNGFGDQINLDYYEITFQKDPRLSLKEFFHALRQRFPLFTRGHETPDIFDPTADRSRSGNEFQPYDISLSANGPVGRRNETLWASPDPKGALMTFVLKSYTPSLFLRATTSGRRLLLVAEQGDVLAACTSETDFIFSTVETEGNGLHPVSGNRGFGLKDNGNDTWTFYTMAADRETKVTIAAREGPYLEFMRPIEGPDVAFKFGHRFWLGFFSNIESFLNRRGTKVIEVFTQNSKRYSYPLPPNVAFHVRPAVIGVSQIASQPPKVNGCWAASAAMVWTWKHGRLVDMEEMARIAGPNYQAALQLDAGMTMPEANEFVKDIGLHAEPPQSYSIQSIADLLRRHGPLWFMTTSDLTDHRGVGLHARIVTGIEGDGSLDGTRIVLIDPATGTTSTESFRIAMEKYEMVVTGRVDKGAALPVQIFHP